MKRKVKNIIATGIACISLSILLCSCADSPFNKNNYYEDGVWLSYNSLSHKAYVGAFLWDGDENNMEFTVPDTYGGYKITTLGGASGKSHPFGVELPSEYKGKRALASCQELPGNATSENTFELTFTICFGKNIDTLLEQLSRYEKFGEAGSEVADTFYVINYYYICSEENETFYSKDGVLYLKSNDEKAKFEIGGDQ